MSNYSYMYFPTREEGGEIDSLFIPMQNSTMVGTDIKPEEGVKIYPGTLIEFEDKGDGESIISFYPQDHDGAEYIAKQNEQLGILSSNSYTITTDEVSAIKSGDIPGHQAEFLQLTFPTEEAVETRLDMFAVNVEGVYKDLAQQYPYRYPQDRSYNNVYNPDIFDYYYVPRDMSAPAPMLINGENRNLVIPSRSILRVPKERREGAPVIMSYYPISPNRLHEMAKEAIFGDTGYPGTFMTTYRQSEFAEMLGGKPGDLIKVTDELPFINTDEGEGLPRTMDGNLKYICSFVNDEFQRSAREMSEFVIKWYSREGRDYSRDEVQAEYEAQDDKEERDKRRQEIMDEQEKRAKENVTQGDNAQEQEKEVFDAERPKLIAEYVEKGREFIAPEKMSEWEECVKKNLANSELGSGYGNKEIFDLALEEMTQLQNGEKVEPFGLVGNIVKEFYDAPTALKNKSAEAPAWAIKKRGNILDQLNSEKYKQMEEYDKKIKEKSLVYQEKRMQKDLEGLKQKRDAIEEGKKVPEWITKKIETIEKDLSAKAITLDGAKDWLQGNGLPAKTFTVGKGQLSISQVDPRIGMACLPNVDISEGNAGQPRDLIYLKDVQQDEFGQDIKVGIKLKFPAEWIKETDNGYEINVPGDLGGLPGIPATRYFDDGVSPVAEKAFVSPEVFYEALQRMQENPEFGKDVTPFALDDFSIVDVVNPVNKNTAEKVQEFSKNVVEEVKRSSPEGLKKESMELVKESDKEVASLMRKMSRGLRDKAVKDAMENALETQKEEVKKLKEEWKIASKEAKEALKEFYTKNALSADKELQKVGIIDAMQEQTLTKAMRDVIEAKNAYKEAKADFRKTKAQYTLPGKIINGIKKAHAHNEMLRSIKREAKRDITKLLDKVDIQRITDNIHSYENANVMLQVMCNNTQYKLDDRKADKLIAKIEFETKHHDRKHSAEWIEIQKERLSELKSEMEYCKEQNEVLTAQMSMNKSVDLETIEEAKRMIEESGLSGRKLDKAIKNLDELTEVVKGYDKDVVAKEVTPSLFNKMKLAKERSAAVKEAMGKDIHTKDRSEEAPIRE